MKRTDDVWTDGGKDAMLLFDWVWVILSLITFCCGIIFAWGNIGGMGLALDASGFLLIFGFGLPSRFGTSWDVPPKMIRIARGMAWTGAVLVLLGFLLQYAGTMHFSFLRPFVGP